MPETPDYRLAVLLDEIRQLTFSMDHTFTRQLFSEEVDVFMLENLKNSLDQLKDLTTAGIELSNQIKPVS